MRPDILAAMLALATLAPAPASPAAEAQPWAYRLGVERPAQQANFCNHRDDALEIAGIFERFGPRTGFSALSNAPGCSRRVHAVTPRALIRAVHVALEGGGSYVVNFILVEVDDGSEPVLVTTRRLVEE